MYYDSTVHKNTFEKHLHKLTFSLQISFAPDQSSMKPSKISKCSLACFSQLVVQGTVTLRSIAPNSFSVSLCNIAPMMCIRGAISFDDVVVLIQP